MEKGAHRYSKSSSKYFSLYSMSCDAMMPAREQRAQVQVSERLPAAEMHSQRGRARWQSRTRWGRGR
jgi:hypothetical protein